METSNRRIWGEESKGLDTDKNTVAHKALMINEDVKLKVVLLRKHL